MIRYFFLTLFIIFFSACLSMPEKRRYFWPPLPDTPRIEYIGTYGTSADFPKLTRGEVLFARLFGEDKGVRVFSKPWGIASNGEGKVYITDAPLMALIIFDMADREVKVIEEVEHPYGIAVDKEGLLYISSRKYHAVMVFDGDGKALRSFGENELVGPAGVGINKELGLLYCVDTLAHDVKVFTLNGDFLYTIGKRGNVEGTFNFPTDVDVGSAGQVVVADSLNARIQIFDKEGRFVRAFGERGKGISGFQMIKGIAVDSEDHIYVTDALASHFKIFSMEGDLLLLLGAPSTAGMPGGFNLPMDIDIDDNDEIHVIDQLNVSFQIYQYLNKKYLEARPVR
ncbi:MAG: 6-bladed beta-propeller [Deltaproteobacteria bacterium]|nr:6-bladed beta-propeller [Deltaproteobacteria bacterium]